MTGTEVKKAVDACLSIVMLTDMPGDVTDKKKQEKKKKPTTGNCGILCLEDHPESSVKTT